MSQTVLRIYPRFIKGSEYRTSEEELIAWRRALDFYMDDSAERILTVPVIKS